MLKRWQSRWCAKIRYAAVIMILKSPVRFVITSPAAGRSHGKITYGKNNANGALAAERVQYMTYGSIVCSTNATNHFVKKREKNRSIALLTQAARAMSWVAVRRAAKRTARMASVFANMATAHKRALAGRLLWNHCAAEIQGALAGFIPVMLLAVHIVILANVFAVMAIARRLGTACLDLAGYTNHAI